MGKNSPSTLFIITLVLLVCALATSSRGQLEPASMNDYAARMSLAQTLIALDVEHEIAPEQLEFTIIADTAGWTVTVSDQTWMGHDLSFSHSGVYDSETSEMSWSGSGSYGVEPIAAAGAGSYNSPNDNDFFWDAVVHVGDRGRKAEIFWHTVIFVGECVFCSCCFSPVCDDLRICYYADDITYYDINNTALYVNSTTGVAMGDPPPTMVPEAPLYEVSSYPNPFNPEVSVNYYLPHQGRLTIRIYNLQGRLVRTLLDENVQAGSGSVQWAGVADGGSRVGAGMYFYRAQFGCEEVVGKVTLVK